MTHHPPHDGPMRVLHVIPSLSPRRGGPTDAVLGLCPKLESMGIESLIVTTDDDVDRHLKVPLLTPTTHEGCRVIFFPRKDGWSRLLRDFSYSPELGGWLHDHIAQYDLLHAHALFSYAPSRAMHLAREQKVPYLCRPLGLLGEWALQQKTFRKSAFLRFIDLENLKNAAAIEYSSRTEAEEAQPLGLPNKGEVIPLGFRPVPEAPNARARLCESLSLDANKVIILFLSRIHPKKGLELLIDSCSSLPKDQFYLLIAGSGEPGYEASIKRRIKRLGLTDQCRWIGFVEGAVKSEILRGADLFVLPSLSESFGIAVAEAMSARCGVIVTNTVPVSEWIAASSAGWVIQPTRNDLTRVLKEAVEQEEERQQRGEKAAQAAKDLTYTQTAQRLSELYRTVIDQPVERVGIAETLRVLHVIPSLSTSQGGPSYAMPMMAKALCEEGIHIDVVTTDDDGAGLRMENVSLGQPEDRGGYCVTQFPKQTEFYKLSLPMLRWLRAHVRGYDIIHIHALFSFASLAAMIAAKESGIPYILRPLGVLNQYGMTQRRRWLKGLSFACLDRPLMNGAAAIHYTSCQERDEAARLQLTASAEIVPLGVDLQGFAAMPDAREFSEHFPQSAGHPCILFLSRIDPKKGLDLLFAAFAAAELPTDTLLIIAGSGEGSYASKLKQDSEQLGISQRLVWTGHLKGSLKLSALAAATIFTLPSQSENFGIALLEAMAAGCACMSSPEVALAKDVAEDDAVEIVQRSVPEWKQALERLMQDRNRREHLSRNAREVAQQRYSLEAMGKGLYQLYNRILHPQNGASLKK